jgi:hypothetical protein
MIRSLYQKLADLAAREFDDIVSRTELVGGTLSSPNKLRLHFRDASFMDIWLSLDGDYAYHWERRRQTGEIFRWDNAPHHRDVRTYPLHFHKGDETNVVESSLPEDPVFALREVLSFVRSSLESAV